eukprot:2642029-Amphidinium_carterae.3
MSAVRATQLDAPLSCVGSARSVAISLRRAWRGCCGSLLHSSPGLSVVRLDPRWHCEGRLRLSLHHTASAILANGFLQQKVFPCQDRPIATYMHIRVLAPGKSRLRTACCELRSALRSPPE